MCGICGIFAFANRDALDPSTVERMTAILEHRGPDDSRLFLDPDHSLALGFRRLSIVDLTTGQQPMANEDGSVWVVFNGEIYNHRELREPLIQRGHRFASQADTEVILHLYEERGAECLQPLRGMFAFAVWDRHRQQLFLARDRLGIKPLYYTFRSGCFLFASEIKSLLAHPSVPRAVNETALYHYLTFITTPAPSTLFEGIQKLPPGFSLTVDRNGNARHEPYWDAIAEPTPDESPENLCVERTRSLLEESVRLHTMSDVPYGVLLSGGIDSSTNVALLARTVSEPVNTFTVGFVGEESYNELEPARRIAQKFATRHHEVLVTSQDLVEYVPRMVYSQDEPIADPVCVPLYFVSKLARDHGVIVLQVGEGSDELFCGYPKYLSFLRLYRGFWRYAERMPWLLRWGSDAIGGPLLCGLRRYTAAEYLRRLACGEPLFWGADNAFNETLKARLVSPRFAKRLKGLSSATVVAPFYAESARRRPRGDFLERLTYLELKLRLAEHLLMRVDKITMSASVEARVPFLDHKLVEFALGIPTNFKIGNYRPKSLLKKAVADLLPADILNRPKQGFSAPVREWFRGDLRGYAAETLFGSRLRECDYLNYDFVRYLLEAHLLGRRDFGSRLWNLVNLSAWYDYWIAGAAPAAPSGSGGARAELPFPVTK